jgi:hypothetical protein
MVQAAPALAWPCRFAIMIRMPTTKSWSSADLDIVIARITPDVLTLLADGVPRAEAAIVAALADRHPKDDVRRTLTRLAVTEQLVETRGRHALPAPASEPG